MKKRDQKMNAQEIYLKMIGEAVERIKACLEFLEQFESSKSIVVFESAVLQARKALEVVAYAAIAPNKEKYEKLRAQADRSADYRKDYNAKKILHLLEEINPNFYPIPLLPPVKLKEGHWHFDRKTKGILTQNRFASFYDRLGKFLHADNPWGKPKGVDNLLKDMQGILAELRELLALHKTTVRTPNFVGVWVVEVPIDGSFPHIFIAQATGEFVEN